MLSQTRIKLSDSQAKVVAVVGANYWPENATSDVDMIGSAFLDQLW